ncbi:YgaP family membrane protein [Haloarchaeobius baliensis]|uniref:YgaP family membrane protein n=1 Tax=Haloarchaeobius baliensis TaxID=1670458 RepID=UPI003F8812A3
MEKNVGGYDRLARLVFGPVLLVVGAAGLAGVLTIAAGTTGLLVAGVLFVIGAVLLVTGVTQRCVLNNLLGRDSYTEQAEATSETDRTGSKTSR